MLPLPREFVWLDMDILSPLKKDRPCGKKGPFWNEIYSKGFFLRNQSAKTHRKEVRAQKEGADQNAPDNGLAGPRQPFLDKGQGGAIQSEGHPLKDRLAGAAAKTGKANYVKQDAITDIPARPTEAPAGPAGGRPGGRFGESPKNRGFFQRRGRLHKAF